MTGLLRVDTRGFPKPSRTSSSDTTGQSCSSMYYYTSTAGQSASISRTQSGGIASCILSKAATPYASKIEKYPQEQADICKSSKQPSAKDKLRRARDNSERIVGVQNVGQKLQNSSYKGEFLIKLIGYPDLEKIGMPEDHFKQTIAYNNWKHHTKEDRTTNDLADWYAPTGMICIQACAFGYDLRIMACAFRHFALVWQDRIPAPVGRHETSRDGGQAVSVTVSVQQELMQQCSHIASAEPKKIPLPSLLASQSDRVKKRIAKRLRITISIEFSLGLNWELSGLLLDFAKLRVVGLEGFWTHGGFSRVRRFRDLMELRFG
ncbi:hypothetical protein BDK51DRAFT_40843 [Blyttiomyces helicus]|uniref:Uncharacterized protein n=1 Tax=Blyttiomyces helicus TaxID=388810 RepID=A0A4P9WHZ4_9FUNG|nr:hypothetical protein BDK51DRAFT_40843 [Blyttiomyces helicus]|eukprot:RKO90740.1 hypothetical protein BDK51DRAFT_40843 [Blyttiomyces helicus]